MTAEPVILVVAPLPPAPPGIPGGPTLPPALVAPPPPPPLANPALNPVPPLEPWGGLTGGVLPEPATDGLGLLPAPQPPPDPPGPPSGPESC